MRTMIIGGLLAVLAGSAMAQEVTETITMRPGFIARWMTPASFRDVVIGNEDVVSATPQSDRQVTIHAKDAGSTNLLFLDSAGRIVSNLVVSVMPPQQNEPNKVIIHNKLGNLAGYTAYNCSPVCVRVEDKLEGEDRPQPTETKSTSTVIYQRGTPPQ